MIRAQRLEQLSEPGQVLVDQCAYDQLAPIDCLELDYLEPRVLKGFADPVAIYRVASHPNTGTDSPSRLKPSKIRRPVAAYL